MNKNSSILIVSPDPGFASGIASGLPTGDRVRIASEASTIARMNGHGADLAFRNDIVIFTADPDDQAELAALSDLLAKRTGETFFVAMTDGDISLEKVRRLRSVGVDEVLPKSISNEDLRGIIEENIEKHQQFQQHSSDGDDGQLICVSQSCGGAGATMVAVNLARFLAGTPGMFRKSSGRKVALIDLDVQFGDAHVFLDLEDNGGFLQLIESAEPPDAAFISGIMQHHPAGLDVLSAPVQVLPLYSMTPDLIAQLLRCLRAQYDHVIVDLPRALVDWLGPVLKQADQMLMVTDTSVPSVRQAKRLIEFYREDHIGLPVEVIINREAKPMFRSEHHKEAEAVLETRLRHWLPDDPRAARKAVDLGVPVVEMSRNAPLSKALRKTAADLFSQQTAKNRKTA